MDQEETEPNTDAAPVVQRLGGAEVVEAARRVDLDDL